VDRTINQWFVILYQQISITFLFYFLLNF
jgi:hypothetical protein